MDICSKRNYLQMITGFLFDDFKEPISTEFRQDEMLNIRKETEFYFLEIISYFYISYFRYVKTLIYRKNKFEYGQSEFSTQNVWSRVGGSQ